MKFVSDHEQRRLAAACFERSGLTLEQLWLRYFALGGADSLLDLDAYVNGLAQLAPAQRDMVAHAVNERLDELTGPPRAPYSRLERWAKPRHGPLSALVGLLDGAHRAPPERLPALVAEAGRALDVEIVVYLADYGQRLLVPLSGDHAAAQQAALDIETTAAGSAFRRANSVVTRNGERPTLWTVVLDGVERLGVLEVVPTDDSDPEDPLLREQCRWLAGLLGHLVTITTQYGDGLDARRRRRNREFPAEMLWHSLPPLTGATDTVIVGASVAPAYDLRGVGFDYALSENTAQLALFDAGAHRAEASLSVVEALSAYRAARHDGAGLAEQHRAVAAVAPGGGCLTGVLAELDLRTGRLSWLSAGHPAPLLVGDGHATAASGRTGPAFGTGSALPPISTHHLAPEELVALVCRGVTEAPNSSGEPFGRENLIGFLARDAATLLPPEAARLLVKAVSGHASDVFHQDVGVLLARWTPGDDNVL
ncbi:PP2C family protein-serine/threonine phosphatase [Amycolatopsis sp. NPDC049252]|uniref:PP2C family protein-serine/threonine phosphatase n=1 Tax=Amycolatopsis sp. NPDC049252 TaxID=3363933 RepID=UPI0037230F99